MHIPVWATHLFTFKLGKAECVVAVTEGKYQYLRNSRGRKEEEYDHEWGVNEWTRALKDVSFQCRIEEINFSLENE
ncbi:hypothetical protein [Citrobacter phage CVT22]|uniref:Uncharacterized protein n=1 Tax=Citrobacter phage CVT22 TaxID=1622234 RepID=A0A0R6CJ16_9CAUD|nr:hypothetical protein APL39_gp53 [Citrobacter phage CVT22]AJT60757.1 hypothetical protein [Citrobacter phage CVT22]